MLTKTLLALGMVAAMSLSMAGAFAQNFDHRDGYRNDYREMNRDRRDFRNDRFDRRAMNRGRGNFERGGRGSWQNGHQNHFAMNNHGFGSGNRGRR